jgi:hypothetical protein
MKNYGIPDELMRSIKWRHAELHNLVRPMAIFEDITKALESQGMEFVDAPDSFFLRKRPAGKSKYYFDDKTMMHIYVQYGLPE